jgi:hypothetical protein
MFQAQGLAGGDTLIDRPCALPAPAIQSPGRLVGWATFSPDDRHRRRDRTADCRDKISFKNIETLTGKTFVS